MTTPQRFDLVVLGSGAAGEKGAAQAAYFGRSVAVVERAADPGGATVGTTVPSKTLRETALTLSGVRARELHGVDLALGEGVTIADFLRHERAVKAAERARVAGNLERHGVTRVHGTGRLAGPGVVEVDTPGGETRRLEARAVLVATGSRPRRPAEYPDDPRVYDSDTVLQMRRLPRKLAVVGGGVIGCEYACTFAALGVAVDLVHSRMGLLDFLDADLGRGLEAAMRRAGIRFLKPAEVTGVEAREDGLELEVNRAPRSYDALMLATGRVPNTEGLGLETVGIVPDARGRIPVDELYRTTAPGVVAAGDVIGPPALASTSMEQARVAVMHELELPSYKRHVAPLLPAGIYTIPEISSVGLSETAAAAEGVDVVVGRAAYADNVRGKIIGDREGFLKLVFERRGQVLRLRGVHVLGEGACELVHVGLMALASGADHTLFIDACFNYPTLGELYKYATYDAMGKAGI